MTLEGMTALLLALWQGDSAFPSGSFAFSNGLEGAVALGGPLDRRRLAQLVANTLRFRWASADRLALMRAYRTTEMPRIGALDRLFEAATTAAPLRSGSRRNGSAFLLAHSRLGTPGAADLRAAVASGQALGHLPVAQGWVWRHCEMDEPSAVATSAYTMATSMVQAAVRLGALGAIEAQGALRDSLPLIVALASAKPEVDEAPAFSTMTPWIDIAGARHSRAPLRLFSN